MGKDVGSKPTTTQIGTERVEARSVKPLLESSILSRPTNPHPNVEYLESTKHDKAVRIDPHEGTYGPGGSVN